jgi:hypothetical protein
MDDQEALLKELRAIRHEVEKIRVYLFGLFVFVGLAYAFARIKGYF